MARVTVKAEIEIPEVPNFLQYEGGTMKVGDVIDTDLRRIGEAWTEALLERAREQRRRAPDSTVQSTTEAPDG